MKIVIKIGGSLMKNGVGDGLIKDAASLSKTHEVVMVHGGGDVVTETATKLGKAQSFVVSPEGVKSRYTDFETAEIYHMVMNGLLAKRLVLALAKEGVRGLSVSGVDGSLLRGTRKTRLVVVDPRGRKVAIEGGYTGKVQTVNTELLDILLGNGYLPIVSPVAMSEEATPLNVDGDRVASTLAKAVKADTVMFLTNVEGLSLNGGLVEHLTTLQVSEQLPNVGFGMQKKVMAAAEAVNGGVPQAIICSGTRDAPISKALAHDSCTVVSNNE